MHAIFRLLPVLALGLTCAVLGSASADAQRFSNERSSEAKHHKSGDFDYYALVLSWSPTHCASPEGRRDHTQCRPRNGRGYSFVLHGLWPQYERGYPEKCRTRFRPFVSEPTITSMMDIMPSKGLIIHEYRKHGTCSGLVPHDYFSLSRELYNKIKIPSPYKAPQKEQFVSPDGIVAQFTAANPELKADMMGVVCRGSGNRLREIRICFTKDGALRSCGKNENQRKLCRAKRMFVPPVRYSQR